MQYKMETNLIGDLQPNDSWFAQIKTQSKTEAYITPLNTDLVETYCQIGIAAYLDHYTHLWKTGNPDPYFNQYYRAEQVLIDLDNSNLVHALIYVQKKPVGILKLDLNRQHPNFYPGNTLFLEKIYILKAYTGLGLGRALLDQFCEWGRQLNRQGLWLETMFKGPARQFYIKYGFRHLGDTSVPYPEVLPQEKGMWVVGVDL
jgi:GNAT superfamily N-acetyltransferase